MFSIWMDMLWIVWPKNTKAFEKFSLFFVFFQRFSPSGYDIVKMKKYSGSSREPCKLPDGLFAAFLFVTKNYHTEKESIYV